MKYDDGLITFEIPAGLESKVVKRKFSSWTIYSKKKKLSFDITVDFATAMMPYYHDYYRKEIRTAQTHINMDTICHCHGPYQTTINGHLVDYCFLVGEVKGMPGLFVPRCCLTISHDQYVIYVDIGIDDRVKTNSFPIDDYWQSICSIKVLNFEKLKQEKDECNRKDAIKYSKKPVPIPVNIPQDFTEFPSVIPMCGGRLLKKDGFEIHITDLTGIGREADIDIFKDALNEGEKIEDTHLWKQLSGKRCLIQNLEGTPLDFLSCKNISILLAFRGKCYSILMKNDQPFNLNDYKLFLDSIGVKTKKTSKNN